MPVDPITLEVVRGRLDLIAEEMQITLIRSAYSDIVKEAADASAAIFDLSGQVLAQAAGIPILLGVLVPAVRCLLDEFSPDMMQRGDVYVLNDPYEGGTHLPDILVAKPVFFQQRPFALACMITHHQDVGGKTPGSIPTDATDVFQEGLRLPPLKLHDAGRPNETLLAILSHNSRLPQHLLGDLDGQLAACELGSARIHELLEEYGEDRIREAISALLDNAERVTRTKISEIPDGRYTFRDYLDNDGVDLEALIAVHAAVTINGADIDIDFEGTSEQVRGPFNATPSSVLAAAFYVLRAVTDPSIPNNAGCYRPLRVHLPKGSLVNPHPPAAVNARSMTFCLIVDVLLGALAQAIPARVPAASYEYPVVSFGGIEPVSGRPYVFYEIGTGGVGARPTMDGVDACRSKAGNTLNSPVEAVEMDFPVRVHDYGLRPDSGGPGRFRGGLGYRKVFHVLRGPVTVSHRGDRHRTAPWGLAGGGSGAMSRSVIVRKDGSEQPIPSKQVFTLDTEDEIHLSSAGGGGYGPAYLRSPHAVREDVLDGKLSVACAREQYGVVIDPDTLALDAAATAAQRSRGATRPPAGSEPGEAAFSGVRAPVQGDPHESGSHGSSRRPQQA